MRRLMLVAAAFAVVTSAGAQTNAEQPTITVIGVGKVSSPPDLAELEINVRGEGKTPDEATKALADRQDAILGGITALDRTTGYDTDEIEIRTVRSSACDKDDDAPKLSTGNCAVIGYVATGKLTVRLSSTKDAGTAVGVAGKLGASYAHIDSFELRSTADAHRKALAAALQNARAQAEAIAVGSGAKLGPLLKVADEQSQGYGEITVTAGRVVNVGDLMTRVPVTIAPSMIDTEAKLFVTYAIERP